MAPNGYACSDGYCGAEDCRRCHPEQFEEGGEFWVDPDLAWSGPYDDWDEDDDDY